MRKILLSGGHLTPALAVIDQAKLSDQEYQFTFLGRLYSQEQQQQLSHEKAEVEKRDVRFVPTTAPKFHKTFWWRNFSEIGKWWPALSTAWNVTTKYKPDVFLSFGGYLAFPIAIVCRLRGVPVITHEQTSTVGLANQMIAFLSVRIAVSQASSMHLFPESKTVLTGNPIRPKLLQKRTKRPEWLTETPDKPILYITGGNQGSEILNTVVEQTLQELTQKWFVIHQCGNPNSTSNYLTRLTNSAKQLTPQQQQNYIVREWIHEDDLLWIFSNTRLVVSRSGANTVQELVVHKVPSVLIPLPFSRNDEQQINAEALEKAGSAVILLQKNLTPDKFLNTLNTVSRRYRSMSEKAEQLKDQTILDGASNILALIEQVLEEKRHYIEKK